MIETQPWTPYPGDTVTWDGHDGSWIVEGGEDDDHVWVYRPGTRMIPVYARPGMVAMQATAPEHEELAPVCQLRPLVPSTDGGKN